MGARHVGGRGAAELWRQASGVPLRADTGQRGGGGARERAPWGAAGAVLAGARGRVGRGPLVCPAEEFILEPALRLPFILKTSCPFLRSFHK